MAISATRFGGVTTTLYTAVVVACILSTTEGRLVAGCGGTFWCFVHTYATSLTAPETHYCWSTEKSIALIIGAHRLPQLIGRAGILLDVPCHPSQERATVRRERRSACYGLGASVPSTQTLKCTLPRVGGVVDPAPSIRTGPSCRSRSFNCKSPSRAYSCAALCCRHRQRSTSFGTLLPLLTCCTGGEFGREQAAA